MLVIKYTNWQYLVLDFSASDGYRVKRRKVAPVVFASGTDAKDPWSRTAPASITYNGGVYSFAFWSLTAQDTTSTYSTAQIQQGTTANDSQSGGDWIVTANAYYIPPLGGAGTGNGDGFVWIDAFDIQLGDFIPDDFVDVKPDPTGTLTIEGNNGYIDTTTEVATGHPITVAARDMLHLKKFAYWLPLVVQGSATVGLPDPHDVVANHGDVVIAFSFYNEVPAGPPPNLVAYNWWWWAQTMWGRVPPIPPWGPPDPWVLQVIGALSLQGAAQSVAPHLRSKVLGIALEQLRLSVGTLEKELNSRGS